MSGNRRDFFSFLGENEIRVESESNNNKKKTLTSSPSFDQGSSWRIMNLCSGKRKGNKYMSKTNKQAKKYIQDTNTQWPVQF